MARLRAGHARPLRNMVMWDVGRPAHRPPGRFAAMRSLTVCRCRGRRPRRPADVGGGGRYAGGMNPSPTGYLLAGVGREVAEGSRLLPTGQKTNGVVMARLCEWVVHERGEGGRQPAPFAVGEECPGTSGDAKPVKAPQASQARPAPHCVGRLFCAGGARAESLPCQREVPSASEAEGFLAVYGRNGQFGTARRNPPGR